MDEFAPTEQADPSIPMADPRPPRDVNGVRIPLLISGIFNCLAALGWFSTCFLFFIGIPLIALAVFEFMAFTKLGGTREDQDSVRGRCKTLAILEICSIVIFNLPSAICGILGLVFHKQFDEEPNG